MAHRSGRDRRRRQTAAPAPRWPGSPGRTARRRCATASANSLTRFGRTSDATSRPWSPMSAAIAVVFPPGAAHASSTRSPAVARAITPTSCDASSWTTNLGSDLDFPRPAPPAFGKSRSDPNGKSRSDPDRSSGLPERTTRPSGAKRVGVVSTPAARSVSASDSRVTRNRLARSVSEAAALLKRHQASAASKP